MQDWVTKSKAMDDCTLCPRRCHADRNAGRKGACHEDSAVQLARAGLHMWEEPCISGIQGSGTVFFSGCSMGCVFCQNRPIASGQIGREVTIERLAEIFIELQEKNAANINLVTAGHYVPQVIEALKLARENGLAVPVVYNSSGYERAETVRMLEGWVDIYLPDFKYMDDDLAWKYSGVKEYSFCAKEALAEMVRQTGTPVFDGEGMMKKGVIVRHMILPGHTRDSKEVLRYLHETYGDTIYISIMNQYTPMEWAKEYPELSRRLTAREYEKVIDFCLEIGIENGFTQEGEAAKESFIPDFNYEGV
ncbi:radical SAM protein [Murimonas intestini]|uniref:Pyruvate formate lyase activating enzyme n=1 Tax=Murimonas intestini TaxID=1337051 RepID=A0AB73T1A2_9FIRM|nr:radical SAM protein [Murimonas intestini]MCR1840451.1 radical SAM protein [Murimonas intestini]MCR1867438.1 radical SAM protein [Murimonas intestini]MCR1884625.1 radical SAM protein [Murimonas intestini]